MKNNKIIFIILSSIIFGLFFVFTSCKSKCNTVSQNLMDSISIEKSFPDWAKNANIYEVNVRQYTPEGTFAAFQQHLPRLKEMGVDILWLMPINPIGEKNRKGSLGSYYAVKDYTAINPEFGTEEDFKKLVTEAHKLGMKVIIDWVANHTGWDNEWITSNPEWYTQDSVGNIIIPKGTDWEDTADLNYDNPELRKAMIDAMSYWVKNADIDGFRCDVAGMIPLSFWLHARKTLDEVKPNLFFLAEDGEPIIHRAFDMTYNWELKDIINDIVKGKKNVSDIVKHLDNEAVRFTPEDIRMNFITNHDENTWSGDEYERLKSQETVDAFTVLTYMIPGMPLTYTGQEEPLKKRLRFFDKDTVGFKNFARQDFIKKLNKLRKNNQSIWSKDYKTSFKLLKNSVPADVLTFVRYDGNNQIITVFNLSGKEQTLKITDNLEGIYENYVGENVIIKSNTDIKLKPWQYSVQVKK